MNRFNRGDRVYVRVAGGGEVERVVWEDRDSITLITNDEEFVKMMEGKVALWPVGFHAEDVRQKVRE